MINYYIKVLQNYVNFNGRARRAEYWYFALASGIISAILNGVGAAMEFPLLSGIYSLVVLLPSIAVGVRRMHDVGKSGWFILIPIYNLILAVTEGNSGENEYGSDPKSDGADLTQGFGAKEETSNFEK